MTVRIGCCGWCEPQAAYFARFPVIEVQSTFYQPPATWAAVRWRTLAPPNFEFCIKAWQLITHTPASPTYRRLRTPIPEEQRNLLGSFRDTEPVWRAWEKTREIAEANRASVILFQCPASFTPSPENVRNLAKFFRSIGPQTARLAWEPRGAWPPALINELCTEHRLLHCVDPFATRSVYGSPLYWRLHGKGGFAYRYTDQDLDELKDMLLEHDVSSPPYILFNNIPMKDDAERFRRLLHNRARLGEG